MAKIQIEIERLLQWAYRDELSKRQTSSAEGIWDHIEEWGQRGGIDPGHGAAQRYPHFGLPHADAEAIELAVGMLPDGMIDWAMESEAIMGDLLGLADTRPPAARPKQRASKITYRDKYRDKLGWRSELVAPPRDVIMVRSLRTAALVTMHAGMGTRPDWHEDPPRPYWIEPERGPIRAKIVGECRGRDLYTTGSYCPLQWLPSPLTIAAARADYLAWHRGLATLAETLVLDAHEALPPAAPEYPWCERFEPRSVYTVDAPSRVKLPLVPQRDRVGPPMRRPRHGLVTIIGRDA